MNQHSVFHIIYLYRVLHWESFLCLDYSKHNWPPKTSVQCCSVTLRTSRVLLLVAGAGGVSWGRLGIWGKGCDLTMMSWSEIQVRIRPPNVPRDEWPKDPQTHWPWLVVSPPSWSCFSHPCIFVGYIASLFATLHHKLSTNMFLYMLKPSQLLIIAFGYFPT